MRRLRKEIPEMAERLRFLHAAVLRWRAPAQMLKKEAIEDNGSEVEKAKTVMEEWEAPKGMYQ